MRLKLLLEQRDAAVISLLRRLAPLSSLRLYRCSATLFDAAMGGGALPAGLATLEVTSMHSDWLSADTVRCIGRLKQLTVLVMETAKQVGIRKAVMVLYRALHINIRWASETGRTCPLILCEWHPFDPKLIMIDSLLETIMLRCMMAACLLHQRHMV